MTPLLRFRDGIFFVDYNGDQCAGCRYCCWAHSIRELPKGPACHCEHESDSGCLLYGDPRRPVSCTDYVCPYILLRLGAGRHRTTAGWPLVRGWPWPGLHAHRPDLLQPVIEELLSGQAGYVMPLVPEFIPVAEAIRLMRRSRSVYSASPGDACWDFKLAMFDPSPHPAEVVVWAKCSWEELAAKATSGLFSKEAAR